MLSNRDRELIGLGASVASGCEPCTKFHVRAARIAGATDAEIAQAVQDALSASAHVAEAMAQFAGEHYAAPKSEILAAGAEPLIRELVSLSAAYAANGASDIEPHIEAARAVGATDLQILAAIKIAGAVEGLAARKVEEAAERAMSVEAAKILDEVSEQVARAAGGGCSGSGDCGPK